MSISLGSSVTATGARDVCCMLQGAALIVAATSVAASTAFYAARGIGRPLAERVISSEMRDVLRASDLFFFVFFFFFGHHSTVCVCSLADAGPFACVPLHLAAAAC